MMNNYYACIGVYVRTYVKFTLQAENDAEAERLAIEKFSEDGADMVWEDTDYKNLALPSICWIDNEDSGNSAAEGVDFALTQSDKLQLAAGKMLETIK